MAETVYIFGAGVNRGIKDANGLRPPLALDLFKQVLRHDTMSGEAIREFADLFAYIERYWKLTAKDLREAPFDLEACFTLLKQQRIEANRDKEYELEERIARVEDQLSSLFTRFLGHIELYAMQDVAIAEIGNRILAESAAVLTFNYDTIVEAAIEFSQGDSSASPPAAGRVSDEDLPYSDFEWNKSLAYGVRFDEVHLQQTKARLDPVEGDRFYGHPDNTLYPAPLLKLHGSLNWFRQTSRRIRPHPYGDTENPKEGQVTLASGFPHVHHGFNAPEDAQGWILEPMIVTPVLYKDLRGDGPVGESWRRAKEELFDCRKLVVAGYSFPPTDFAVTKLFLEAFVDGPPDELVSVNPNHHVARRAAELCHFSITPLVRENLEEYLDHPSA